MKSSFFFKSGLWLLCGHWIEKQFNSLNSVFVASMYVSYPILRLTACWLIQHLPHQMSSLILQVFRWILSWYTGCLLNRYQAVSIWTLEQGMDLQSKTFVKLYHHNILFASCTNSYHLWMNNGIWDCKHCFTHSFYYRSNEVSIRMKLWLSHLSHWSYRWFLKESSFQLSWVDNFLSKQLILNCELLNIMMNEWQFTWWESCNGAVFALWVAVLDGYFKLTASLQVKLSIIFANYSMSCCVINISRRIFSEVHDISLK